MRKQMNNGRKEELKDHLLYKRRERSKLRGYRMKAKQQESERGNIRAGGRKRKTNGRRREV